MDKQEKINRILRQTQTISVLADCIDMEFNSDLVDYQFKDPRISNHSRRIKESIAQIKLYIGSGQVKVIDQEFFTYEHAVQVHRLFTYFSTMDTDQLTELMDGFDELERKNAIA